MRKRMGKSGIGKIKESKGFILITSYLLLSTLMVFALGAFTWASAFLQSSERNKKKIMAFNIAEAGFDDAYYRVKSSSITYPWSSGYTSMTSGGFQGGYSTTVTDMGSNIKKIQVTAYSPSQTSTAESVESRTVTGYVQTGSGGNFDYAAFGATEVTINGNASIDSYNASAGAYSSSSALQNGKVGTNATGADKLTLQGNSSVKGDLNSGAGSTPSTVIDISGSASTTGSQTALTTAKSMSVISSSMTSSGSLNLNGNTTYTMAAGTYRFSSFKINGNAQLVTTGAVTIYVDGEITLNGNGVATASNTPSNMIIYGTSDAKVTLNGNNSFYGAIYAPLAEFEVNGNAKVYGSLIGNDMEIDGNAKIHFDQSLSTGSSNAATLLSWNESNLTNS